MNKLKKIKPIYFIIFAFIIFIVGVTSAYIYVNSTFQNKFKTSAYDIELKEEFDNDWGTKRVNIINHDSTPVVLRINYNELWTEKNPAQGNLLTGNIQDNSISSYSFSSSNESCRIKMFNDNSNQFTLSNIINGEDVVTKEWTPTWNDFVIASDGWYYYNKILDTGFNIQILESISLRNDLIASSNCYADYKNYEYELSFNYEVIQSSVAAIKDIWGYDVTINEGDITWPF